MSWIDNFFTICAEIGPEGLLYASIITIIASAIQGTLGIGFAILSVPILVIIDPILAPVPQLLVVMPLTIGMAFRERHAIKLRPVLWILLGRLPGAALGALLLVFASSQVLSVMIGGAVLVAVLLMTTNTFVLQRNARTEFLMGAASAASSVVSSIGGPPIALLYRGQSGAETRAQLGLIFSIGLMLSIAVRFAAESIAFSDIVVAVVILPSLLVGFALSSWTKNLVQEKLLQSGLMALCAVAGGILLVKSLLA